jgi:hypothetical protein
MPRFGERLFRGFGNVVENVLPFFLFLFGLYFLVLQTLKLARRFTYFPSQSEFFAG